MLFFFKQKTAYEMEESDWSSGVLFRSRSDRGGDRAFTRVCTTELCSFTQDYGTFQDADTELLPISVDSVPTLREFKAKERISVELLSDFTREVSRRYGTMLEDRFHSNRSYVVIDRDGIVRGTFAEEATRNRRENAELLERIRALG